MHLHFVLLTAWKNEQLTNKLPTKDQYRNKLRVRASRGSELRKYSRLYISKLLLFFQCFSWYLRILIIWHVYWLHCYICTFNAVSLLYITHDMAWWHYKRLTSYRKNTRIEIIYSMRASRASEENKLHFYIPNLLFLSLFWLVLQLFCRYNMTFNR